MKMKCFSMDLRVASRATDRMKAKRNFARAKEKERTPRRASRQREADTRQGPSSSARVKEALGQPPLGLASTPPCAVWLRPAIVWGHFGKALHQSPLPFQLNENHQLSLHYGLWYRCLVCVQRRTTMVLCSSLKLYLLHSFITTASSHILP